MTSSSSLLSVEIICPPTRVRALDAHILVIDDEPDHREILKLNLSAQGYTCYAAADGEEGFTKITQQNFDVVITDYHMPKMNGIQFIEKVRKVPRISKVPIIFMTGDSDSNVRRRALLAGANQVLAKPYSTDELLQALRLV